VELRDYLQILRRRWLSALIVGLVVLLAVTVVTLSMTNKYTATTRLFFAVQGTESVSDLAQGSTFAEKQMTSYAQVATSPLVLDSVIHKLSLETNSTELARTVSATVPTDTVIIEIAATSPDPALAASIANAIGVELARVAGTLAPPQSSGSRAVKATTLARAEVPEDPSSPKILRNLIIGLVLGLVLGASVALLRHVLDTKVRSEAEVRALTDSTVLGVVSYADEMPKHPVILRDDPSSASSEAVRRLRTNLQFIDVASRPRSIVVTSSIPGEGKSTIVLNLAVSLADTGARVLLVDADLRRPSIAEYAGIEGAVGLTTVLIGRANVADVIQPWGDGPLDVLPAGPIPPNPSELLGSVAMVTLLEQLTAAYDMVLLDSPPILPVTDAAVLSNLAGGALVIVGTDRIHRAQLLDTLESLNTAGAHIFGVVINKVSRRDGGGYGYDSAYGYRARDEHQPEPAALISGAENLQPVPRRLLEQGRV
jgi:succinoglycan biosynthesis transport protein ExoP